jgi:hypothetical protein
VAEMSDVETERQRRLHLWRQIAQEQDLNSIEPQRLRALGIYGGAQGIWVDPLANIKTMKLMMKITEITVATSALSIGARYEKLSKRVNWSA